MYNIIICKGFPGVREQVTVSIGALQVETKEVRATKVYNVNFQRATKYLNQLDPKQAHKIHGRKMDFHLRPRTECDAMSSEIITHNYNLSLLKTFCFSTLSFYILISLNKTCVGFFLLWIFYLNHRHTTYTDTTTCTHLGYFQWADIIRVNGIHFWKEISQ